MKRLLTAILMAFVSGASMAADLYHPPACDIMASSYGTRNGDTLTNIITQVGTRRVNMIIDGGVWNIGTNVAFSSNVCVTVTPGSYFDISNNVVMTFYTNELAAGHWTVFSGSGTATGTALFVYRATQWGDTNSYQIGYGDIGSGTLITTDNLQTNWNLTFPGLASAAKTNVSNYFIDATTQDMDYARVRNDLVVGDDLTASGTVSFSELYVNGVQITGNSSNTTAFNLQYDGSNSPNYSLYFNGYPKLTLSTNWITMSSDGGTLPTVSSMTNAFDLDMASCSTTGTISTDKHIIMVRLATNYSGYVTCKLTYKDTSASDSIVWDIGYGSDVKLTSGVMEGGYGDSQDGNGGSTRDSTFRKGWAARPFTGSNVVFMIRGTGSGGAGNYSIYDFSVYGVTNSWNSYGSF